MSSLDHQFEDTNLEHGADLLELQEHVNQETSHILQEDLHEGITALLSSNFKSCEDVDETMLVSSKIHAMQLQLQDTNRILKGESTGKIDLHQAQHQISIIQHNLDEQIAYMVRLDKRAQDLEKELEVSHKATKDKDNQMAKLEDVMQEQEKKLTILQNKLEASENSLLLLQEQISHSDEVVTFRDKLSVSMQTELVSDNLEIFAHSTVSDNKVGRSASSFLEEQVPSLTALIGELKEKLEESESLREDLQKKLKEQMLEFQNEKSSWEQMHADTINSLTFQLEHAEEQAKEMAAKDKQEKERLNEELSDLKEKLTLAAENRQNLEHNQELQSYTEKVQCLQEEREKMHQELVLPRDVYEVSIKPEGSPCKGLTDMSMDSFRHELADLKKNLDRVKARKEHEHCKLDQIHEDQNDDELGYLSEITSFEKYLIPTLKQEMFDQSDNVQHSSRIELDSDFILEQSLDSTLEGNLNLLCSPMPITNVLVEGASVGTLLDPESFAVYLSCYQGSPEVQSKVAKLSSERLMQRCLVLMEELQNKEHQLQKSSNALEEALAKWREVTAELSAAQLELERERTFRKIDFELQEETADVFQMESQQTHPKQEVREAGVPVPSIEQLTNDHNLLKSTLLAREDSLAQLLEENIAVKENLDKALELNTKLEFDIAELGHTLRESEKCRESDRQEFDNKLNAKGMEQQLLHVTIKEKEAEFYEREKNLLDQLSVLKEVKAELEGRLLQEVNLSNENFQRDIKTSEQNWMEQMDSLKQEHEKELNLLCANHQDELFTVRSDLQAEKQKLEVLNLQTQQVQSAHHLELEALRLSLTNMHAAHLELSQANLQKEKEKALAQLRETLNDKHAQELAILQTRHQFDSQHQQNHHSEEMDRVLTRHCQKVDQLQGDYSRETLQLKDEHAQVIDEQLEAHSLEIFQLQDQQIKEIDRLHEEHLQKVKERETQEMQTQQDLACLRENIVTELSVTHEHALKTLQKQLEDERKRCLELTDQELVLRLELNQLRENLQEISTRNYQEQDASCPTRTTLNSDLSKGLPYCSSTLGKEQDTETHKEYDGQYQVFSQSQCGYPKQRDQANEEINFFWSQLDSNRSSRQELNALKEQLLARTAQVDEIKRLKQEFEDQKRQMRTDHEQEMEELRIYFEQKSRATEESFREELDSLHQRVHQMSDEDREERSSISPAMVEALVSESDQMDLLQQLTDQLEQHKEELAFLRLQAEEKHKQDLDNLQATLMLQYKEDVRNIKMELSDRYISEIEALKKKQCLALEHLRARLSEEHIREIKLHLQKAQESSTQEAKVESQVFEEDHQFSLAVNCDVLEMKSSSEVTKGKKIDQFCQTEPHCIFQDSEESFNDGVTVFKEQYLKHVSNAPLKDPCNELESLGEHMAGEYVEPTQLFYAEFDTSLSDTQNRIELHHAENSEKQDNLLRSLQQERLPEEYMKKNRNVFISLHKQQQEDLDINLSELQWRNETELGSPISELNIQHKEEPGLCVSALQSRHEEDFNVLITELQHQEELRARVLQLECQHQEDLIALVSEHETQIENLETMNSSKLDNLESSYITEIQKIRDEHALALADVEICLAERLKEKETEMQDRLARAEEQWMEQHEQKLHLAQELLRKELAAVHIEKFQAMTKELEIAHMEDVNKNLGQLRCQLEAEKNQALDALRDHVLQMEKKNMLALQELQDLHKAEVQKKIQEQSLKLQDEFNRLNEMLQKQELLISERTAECQNLSAELQEKCEHQQKLQEEMELLKSQTEMLLQQQVAQLTEEYEAKKSSAVLEEEEQLKQLNEEAEKKQTSHQLETEHLTAQLQEKDQIVLDLQERMSVVTKEKETSESQLEVLVQRRDRENQESDNLVAMLRSDTQTSQQELQKLQDSCQRLLKVFTDVLKNSLSIEDLICKNIGLCLDKTLMQKDVDDTMDTLTCAVKLHDFVKDRNLPEYNEKHRVSPDCEMLTEHSLMSSDEGCELSEYLCDSVIGGLEVGLENEEKILQISQRLRAAVEKLLEMVTGSAFQIEQTRDMQQRFQEEFSSRNQEMAQVVNQNQDLLKRLVEETDAKNNLQVELHKAQGLIDGYVAEHAAMEETLSKKESTEHNLIMELEKSQAQLKNLAKEPVVSTEQRELLLRLQEILSGNMKDVEVELLKETERLAKEKLELQCQSQKDQSNLLSQMKVLEMEIEEQISRNQELMKKTSEMPDLKQQIQSLEKQQKNQRQFMDEQAVEREHERDEFQQEIQKLEEQLKLALKTQGDFRAYGIETLEAQAKEKADGYNALLKGKDDLEQQVADHNEEIDKMSLRIKDLEQAAKQCGNLEAELQKMHAVEKELLQDKEALQQKQYNNVLQISALQSKLDESRHRMPIEGDSDNVLKEELQAEREALLRKEKEAESLAEQLEQFREELLNKTEEILQLSMQLEIQRKQNDLSAQQAEVESMQVKEEMATLKQQMDHGRSNSILQLPQALLLEKNQEIDHLNEQLLRLQLKAVETQNTEVEDLTSVIEHLRGDQERLRRDKDEEVEGLHEIIAKLQSELEQLGPNRHEISDSQESLDQLGLGEVFLQKELRKGGQQSYASCETYADKGRALSVELQQLEFEKTLCDSELETKRQLEEALHNDKIKVLEENLHNLQESYKQQTQEVGFHQMQLSSLREENELLGALVSERDVEVATLSSKVQEIQDLLRERDTSLVEKDLLVQTLQEQRTADILEMENQLAQRSFLLEEQAAELQELQESNASLQERLESFSIEYSEKENEYKEELQDLKEQLRKYEVRVQCLTEDIQKLEVKTANQSVNQNICTAELPSHSECLEIKVENLQGTTISKMSEQSNQDDRVNNLYDLSAFLKPRSFTDSLTDMSAWDSPDMVRKQEEQNHSLRVFTPFSDISIECTNEQNLKSSLHLVQPNQHVHLGSSTPSLSGSNYSIPLSNDTRRSSLVGDVPYTVTDCASCEDTRSESDHVMNYKQSDNLYWKSEHVNSFRPDLGGERILQHREKENSLNTKGIPENLQFMLNKVHEESCKILALSERPMVQIPCEECSKYALQSELWHQEKLSLQEAIHSLSSALTQAMNKNEKDSHHSSSDWRKELLQSVQMLLENEMAYLRLDVKSHLCQYDSGDKSILLEKLELMMKAQEEQKRIVLEHLLASDRGSLLSEIQELRSQLRMANLQNQEKLQQLQESLTNAEERGTTKEHHMRRQVELLEYKLQQETSISEDLKASLTHERDRASEQHRLLLLEQASVSQLRGEQEEILMEQEKLLQSQKELHKEISTLREQLEIKEQAMQAFTKQQELDRKRTEEEKIGWQRKADVKEKSIQELSTSLDEQRVKNNKLSAALNQEQSCTNNLRRELQIEQSRFEALLSQEHSKSRQTENELERVKQHSQSLSNTLAQEKNTVDQLKHEHTRELSKKDLEMQQEHNEHTRELSKKDLEKQQEHNLVLELQSQLKEERNHARELAAMMEKTQHQAVSAKRQLESEVQCSREEFQREREAGIKLRAMLESVQCQKQHLDSSVELHRERESHLQKEREQYQAQVLKLQEEKRSWMKEREKERKRDQEAKANKEKEEWERRIQDFRIQHERDQRRIQELQDMLADLEEQERALRSQKSHLLTDSYSPSRNINGFSSSTVQCHKLENIWKQLFNIVLQVKRWTQNKKSVIAGLPAEEEVASLLEKLSKLRFELQQEYDQSPSKSHSSSIDVLRRENEELTKSVTLLTKEKLALRSQLAQLHNSLQVCPQRRVDSEQQVRTSDAEDSVLESERAVWQREKRLLQIALKHAESELGRVTTENKQVPDVANCKVQHLYRKYMRAESFRKALVYQKKYLLLLLGGFQACEKATLSLISRMGAYPTPAEVQVPTNHKPGLTKFRSAVRVVIAISRLKFLQKKWNKKSRKGSNGEAGIQSSNLLQQVNSRTDVLQQLGSNLLNSPPTRDVPLCLHHSPVTRVIVSPKELDSTSNRLSNATILTPRRLHCPSQVPEHSLTEYIKHLEMVQQRLGGL